MGQGSCNTCLVPESVNVPLRQLLPHFGCRIWHDLRWSCSYVDLLRIAVFIVHDVKAHTLAGRVVLLGFDLLGARRIS